MLLKTEGLTKLFGNFRALDSLDMTVEKGSIVGFVGPNGAGKTTAMRIMSTLMPASGGEVYINDLPVSRNVMYARKCIGFVPDYFGVYSAINPVEFLEYYADMYKLPKEGRGQLIKDTLELVNLADKTESDVNKLSRGMKQRLCLARCLLQDSELLILDEPASGLDPQARADLKFILRALREQGKSVLISSHILPELGEFCDKVVILNHGKKLAEGSIDEISRLIGEKAKISYTLIKEEDFENAAAVAKTHEKTGDVFRRGNVLEVEFSGTDDEIVGLSKRMYMSGISVLTVGKTQHTLEEIFLEVIDNDKK